MMQGLKRLGRTVSIVGCVAVAAPAWSRESGRMTPVQAQTASLFVISYRLGSKWKPKVPLREQGLRDHFYYIKKLDDEGRIVLAGPVGDDRGLVLVHAASEAAAAAVIAEDPAVRAGLFIGEARRFVPTFVGDTPVLPVKP